MHRLLSRPTSLLVLLVMLALGAAACGDDDDASSGATTTVDDPSAEDEADGEAADQAEEEQDGDAAAGEAVSANSYAEGVCGAMTDWISDLQELAGNIQPPSENSAEAARDLLVAFLDDAIGATDTMLEKVDSAGHPDIDDGEALAADLREGLTGVKTIFEDGRERAANVSTDSPEAFQAEAQQLGQDIQSATETLGESLSDLESKYDVPELEAAFDEEASCAQLNQAS